MPTDVRRMLRQIVAGNRGAAAWLYDRFAGRLFRRLRLRYPRLDPESLLHDTYLACLRNQAELIQRLLDRDGGEELSESQVERHLWDLACGIAANRRRAMRRRRQVPLDEQAAAVTDIQPEAAHLQRDTLEQLDRCLRGQRARIYLYFKLRYYEGLTPEEISRATGWSRKATYKLRQALNEAVRRCADQLGIHLD